MTKIYFEIINDDICKYAKKPTPAVLGVAEWWKNIPKYCNDNIFDIPECVNHRSKATIRSCPGINDSLNFGYMMYFPTDIYIDASEDTIRWFIPNIDFSKIKVSELNYVEASSDQTSKGFIVGDEFHHNSLKMNPMWGIKTAQGYSSWFTSPVNRLDLPFKIIDAVVDTDVFPSRFPISFYVKRGFKGTIKAGTPFLQVVPFKRDNFDSEIIELDEKDVIEKNYSSRIHFTNFYKKIFWTRKKFF